MNSGNAKIYREVVKCASCQYVGLTEIYNFGFVPLAGYFPKAGSENELYKLPMRLLFCSSCELVQISPDVDDDILFSDYRYISSIGMQNHFNEFANWFSQKFDVSKAKKILEIGCNDGPLLDALTVKGFQPIGIDPADNIAEMAIKKGFNVIKDFFNSQAVVKYDLSENFDVVISCNSFAHVSNVCELAESVSKSLNSQGLFIVEVQSVFDMIRTNSLDFVYHEHKYYYSIKSISNLLSRYGLYLIDGHKIATHGGSYRLVFSKVPKDKSNEILSLEREENQAKDFVVVLQKSILNFFDEVGRLSNFLTQCREKNKKVVAFGASGRANMLLAYLGDPVNCISIVFDESIERFGRNMGFTKIPIISFSSIENYSFDYLIILAWNYKSVLLSKLPSGLKLICPLPKFQELNS